MAERSARPVVVEVEVVVVMMERVVMVEKVVVMVWCWK